MKRAKKIVNRIERDIRQFWAAGAAFAIYYVIIHAIFDAFCPLLVTVGFPCPGCGLTRAGLYLLKGNIIQAAVINPSIFLVVLFLAYCGYFRYIRGTKTKGFSFVLGVFVAAVISIYIYRMYLYFPNRAPYVYHRKNLLAEILPWYESLIGQILK